MDTVSMLEILPYIIRQDYPDLVRSFILIFFSFEEIDKIPFSQAGGNTSCNEE